MILADPYLSRTYQDIYAAMLAAANQCLEHHTTAIEIGSAGGIFSISMGSRSVISSDIRFDIDLDLVLDAQNIPFANNSLDVLFMKDSLHHIPDVESFLIEANRVLKVGGGIVCVDPYWRGVAKWIYRWFHPEPFNEKQSDWNFESNDPTFSNQAILFILLRRDRAKFENCYPQFEIIELGPLLGPSYILSGGVTAPRVVPKYFLLALRNLENQTRFWRRFFALEYLVVLRKRLV